MKTCKVCNKEKPLTEFSWYKRVHDKAPRSNCKQCHNDAEKARDKSHRTTQEPGYKRAERLRRTYNLTPEEYDSMRILQNNKCAICNEKLELFIDHCHETGKVRGLLCRMHNLILGYAKDDIELLQSCIKYLEKASKQI